MTLSYATLRDLHLLAVWALHHYIKLSAQHTRDSTVFGSAMHDYKACQCRYNNTSSTHERFNYSTHHLAHHPGPSETGNMIRYRKNQLYHSTTSAVDPVSWQKRGMLFILMSFHPVSRKYLHDFILWESFDTLTWPCLVVPHERQRSILD